MEYGSLDVFADLWDADAVEASEYHEAPPSDDDVRSIESELGCRLPSAYVDLARRHNGGLLRRDAHPTARPTSWADNHVGVTGIFAIGRTAPSSLCGSNGQRLWLEEWGYPAIGVYFADTPSAGHDMIALDYRTCRATGDPCVVHVDQELGYAVTQLADTFQDFIAGLVEERSFPD
ncbi:SMI1/KNR4 family protein [Actinopolymorpha sp. B9G3]|uniref:SMI1/KNR4 family protein n=1 Tax=Actinopolymorpha sp. B9G3 TaxID=3158970 RepID=UPI0032D969F6